MLVVPLRSCIRLARRPSRNPFPCVDGEDERAPARLSGGSEASVGLVMGAKFGSAVRMYNITRLFLKGKRFGIW